jgi:Family of unknown function (DUF6058)
MEDIALAEIAEDVAYVRARYVQLTTLAADRARVDALEAVAGRTMPRATYALADGSLWYAPDWWRLYDEAGSFADVRAAFARRYAAAGGGDLGAAWGAYVAGLYGACLLEVTPETIVAKEQLVARLDRALAAPAPDDAAWRARLRADVDALDALERPFAACDRIRFGRPTTRDRLITGVRRAYPQIW